MIKSVMPEEKLKKFWLTGGPRCFCDQCPAESEKEKDVEKHKHKVERGSCGWWDVSVDWQRQIRVNG